MYLKSLIEYLAAVPGIIIALTVHGYVQAVCSARLGDPVPKLRGFLSLNPLRHLEPIGFVLLLIFGYGWGKPVDTSIAYYKDRKRGVLVTYLVPSLVNVLTAFVFVCLAMLSSLAAGMPSASMIPIAVFRVIYYILFFTARYNLAVALFNLIPVYPMDANRILSVCLSPNNAVKLSSYEKIFQIILVLLLTMGLVGRVLDPIVGLLLSVAL